jgi:hypothetical protein
MLAVQRPDVDDTDRRATQPPAHFRRVLRSFAFGPTAHRSRGRQNPLSCFIFSSCRHSKKACKAGALQSGMITKARSSCKRHCFHSEPDAGCCSDTCNSQQSIGHRGYGPCRRSDGNGGRRVCVRPLPRNLGKFLPPYRWRFGQVGGFSGTRSSFLPTDGASRVRCSQADTEKADVELERKELKTDDAGEHTELAAIYVGRGLAVEFGSVLLHLEALHRS